MAHAVFYEPSSALSQSGRIIAMVSGPMEVIEADGRAFVYVDEPALDLDVTHVVIDGEVVIKPENRT